jgi:tetratricopeptide (TPR) repeat protein
MTPRSTSRIELPRILGILLLLHLLAFLAVAQGSDPFSDITKAAGGIRGFGSKGGTVLLISVFSDNGRTRLDRQSVVKATNETANTVNWTTTDEKSEATIELTLTGHYQIEVSAVGYLSEQKEIQIAGSFNTLPMEVTLHRDPAAANLNIADAAMPAKARKEAKHGVSSLKSGNLKDARKNLDAAYTLDPSNPDLNYLLGYLYYQQRDFTQARSFLGTASTLNPRHLEALTLLGRVELIQEDYPAAAATLEKAVDADPDSWLAHNYLADAYLKEKKFEQARQQAQLAISQGKIAANPANLALGQALVNLGKREEGVRILKAFVQDAPKNPAAPQVRDLIAALEAPRPDPVPVTAVAGTKNDSRNEPKITETKPESLPGVDPLLSSPELSVSVKSWQPPGIDEVLPPVAAGVGCPLETVMEMSGERVKELVDDVSRIAAIEHLLHERMDEMGNPASRETRDYNYVTSITEDTPGFLAVEESRSERLTRTDYPDQIMSSGFAALALVFHPSMRDNFEMTCEGLGHWHDQAAWLVHFKQRVDRPARIHDYRVGSNDYAVRLKGRAWITADKFHIVRIESQLISAMPQIQLRSEQQVVEYGPVRFQAKNEELWLPKSAEIYLDFRKRRYFRRHSFDHYMLFSIDSAEKRNEPKAPLVDPSDKPLPN